MATIQKNIIKGGISYKITVCYGRDRSGRQKRHYTTYTPPEGMKESRAYKEAVLVAAQFEEKIRQGYQIDAKICFEEYSEQFLVTKQRAGLKKSTYDRYVLLLRRINPAIGHMKLQDIRPQHLNMFYQNLMERGIRLDSDMAVCREPLEGVMTKMDMSQERLARLAGISAATIRKARHGQAIVWDKAELIANALGIPADELFVRQHNDEPLSDKSVVEHHRLIRCILGQAEKELLVPYNAAAKATPPKALRSEVNTLQPEEIVAILEALKNEPLKWQAIVHLMIVTGCRRGEIIGLKWEQVDLENGILHICGTLLSLSCGIHSDTPKTPESRRYIKIPAETIELLKKHRAEQDVFRKNLRDYWQENGYVFTRDNGLPIHPDSVNQWLNKFAARHSLPRLNPHAFRHSMASILINEGQDILAVSRRLGHANASTTLNIYGHILKRADAQSSECIAEVLLRNGGGGSKA